MKLHVVPTSAGHLDQSLISYVIGDDVAIDAGCLTSLDPEPRRRIEHVFLSHSHLDHVASLGPFLEDVYAATGRATSVYGLPETLEAVRTHLFNDQLWPDLDRLAIRGFNMVHWVPLSPYDEVETPHFRIIAAALEHTVPSLGFLVAGREQGTVAIISDTGPTHHIWELARNQPLRAVFLEASFPNELGQVARASQHLCPADWPAALAHVPADIPILAVHVKAVHREAIARQLAAITPWNIELAVPGTTYEF